VSYVKAYVFTCEQCPARCDIPCGQVRDHRAAEQHLRAAGWGVTRGRHTCPEHKRANVQAARAGVLGRAARSAIREGRVEDYAELRSWGLTRAQAAERLGVSYRTAMRYQRSAA
jgi:hypothetical protein